MTYRPEYASFCPGGCITDLSRLDTAQLVTRPDGSVSCLPCWEADRADADDLPTERAETDLPGDSKDLGTTTLERQRREYGALTNADLAQDIGQTVRYLASALGILFASEGTFSLERACRGQAIKSDLWAILDLLREIKKEARATVEAGKRFEPRADVRAAVSALKTDGREHCDSACYAKGGHRHGTTDHHRNLGA